MHILYKVTHFQAFATDGSTMYYILFLLLFRPMDMAPLNSLLSKCVGVNEFGKLFTVSTILPMTFTVVLTSLNNLLYEATLDTFPGAMFVICACSNYGCVVLILILYYYVTKHEREYGKLGRAQNAHLGLNK